MYSGLVLWVYMVITVLAESSLTLPIYGRNLSDQKQVIEIGVINYITDQHHGTFERTFDDKLEGSYCLTTSKNEGGCIAVVDTLDYKQFNIHLNGQQQIHYVTVRNMDPNGKKTKALSDVVPVNGPNIAPSPNLNPSNVPKKNNARDQGVGAGNGEGNKENEEEVEKSWVQKNWLYIVPPLLIMFVLMGDDK